MSKRVGARVNHLQKFVVTGISESTLYAQKTGCSVNLKINLKMVSKEGLADNSGIEKREDLGISHGNTVVFAVEDGGTFT